jgi:hypothetical protein
LSGNFTLGRHGRALLFSASDKTRHQQSEPEKSDSSRKDISSRALHLHDVVGVPLFPDPGFEKKGRSTKLKDGYADQAHFTNKAAQSLDYLCGWRSRNRGCEPLCAQSKDTRKPLSDKMLSFFHHSCTHVERETIEIGCNGKVTRDALLVKVLLLIVSFFRGALSSEFWGKDRKQAPRRDTKYLSAWGWFPALCLTICSCAADHEGSFRRQAGHEVIRWRSDLSV